jgi:Holliday junction resolvase
LNDLKIPKRLQNSKGYRRSPKQERELATRYGGRNTPASGSGDIKGDVRKKGVYRIEAKTTQAKSFSVTREMIDKIETHALSSGELPAIVIEFLDQDGKPEKEVCILPMFVVDILANWRDEK